MMLELKVRRLALSLATLAGLACLRGSAFADFLPDGRMDYGMEGLPIPKPPVTNQTNPRTLQLLVDAVGRAPTLADAVRLTREIASCQVPAAIDPIKRLLKDSRVEVRAEAATGVALLARSSFQDLKLQQVLAADAALVQALEAMAADADASVRTAAVDALVAVTAGKTPVLERALSKPADESVFRRAVSLARQPSDAKAIAGVWKELTEPARLLAAEALGRCGDASHVSLVKPMLKEGLPQKVAALHALAGMKAASERAAVEAALRDSSPTVRREAMLATSAVAEPEARRDAALRMIRDADPTVRQAAVTVLEGSITPAALQPIADQLGHEYKPLYDTALRVLSTQKDAAVRQAAIEIAARLLENDDPRRRQDGSYVLGAYRSDAALEKHIALVAASAGDKPDWVLIRQAAESLGRIGRPEAKPAIAALAHQTRKMMTGGEEDHRLAVCQALIAGARLGEASVLPDCLVPATGSAMTTPADLRAAGVFGIGLLGTPANGGIMPGIIKGEMDGMEAKLEAIKAIGNLRAKSQLGALKRESMFNNETQWMAHWATGRITGESSPFVPDAELWQPDVSITDLPAR